MELGSLLQSFMAQPTATSPASGTDKLLNELPGTATDGDASGGQSFLQAIRQYLSGMHDRSVSNDPVSDSGLAEHEEADSQLIDLIADDPALAALVEMIQQAAVVNSATGIESVASAFTDMDDDALRVLLDHDLDDIKDELSEALLSAGESNGAAWGKAMVAFKAGTEKAGVQQPTADQLMAQQHQNRAMQAMESNDQTLPSANGVPLQSRTQLAQITDDDMQWYGPRSDNGRLVGPSVSLPDGELTPSKNMPENQQRLFDAGSQPIETATDDELIETRFSHLGNLKSGPEPSSATGNTLEEDAMALKGESRQIQGDDAASTEKHHQSSTQAEGTNASFRETAKNDTTAYDASRPDSPSIDNGTQNRAQTTTSLTGPSQQQAADNGFHKAVMDQIVEKAMIRSTNTGSEVRIQLKPEFLGDVRMSITSENNQLSLKMIADQHTTKEILEGQLHHLKAELDKQGLVVDKIEVMVNANTDQHQNREQFFQMFKEHYAGGGRRESDGNRQQHQGQQQPPNAENANKLQSSEENGINYFA